MTNELNGMQPTMKFRWFRCHMGKIRNHPSALRIGDALYAQVLQQWWESDIDGEWRDIGISDDE